MLSGRKHKPCILVKGSSNASVVVLVPKQCKVLARVEDDDGYDHDRCLRLDNCNKSGDMA